MKKLIKFIKRSILSFIAIIAVLIIGIIYIYENSIDKVLSQKQQDWVFNTIRQAEDLPDSFYV